MGNGGGGVENGVGKGERRGDQKGGRGMGKEKGVIRVDNQDFLIPVRYRG